MGIIEHLCMILQEETSLEAITLKQKQSPDLYRRFSQIQHKKFLFSMLLMNRYTKLPTDNIPITLLLIKKHIQTPSVILEISQDILQQSNWESYHLSRITDILHFLQLQDGKTSLTYL